MPRTLIVALVVAATLVGGLGALATFRLDRDLDVGTVRMGVDVGRSGSLDLYVPLVDWGVRFPVVRAPARISLDVRTIDRDAVTRLADGGQLDVAQVRVQARDALASYLRLALLVCAVAALGFGSLVALAVRGGPRPRLRATLAAVGVTTLASTALLAVTLPPRSNVDRPEYYANGPEVPAALRALESLGASAQTLDEEIEDQLVGIARLVEAPAGRAPLERVPRLTVASDLHNNVLALPALERAAGGGPVLFAGDLTDRGSQLERKLALRVVGAGTRLVFVSGNHESDALQRRLARAGAIVLTRSGRLLGDGSRGPLVVRVGGLRIAGYDDPLMRRSRDNYRDRGAKYSRSQQEAFDAWLGQVQERADVVMVHAPKLAELAVERLRAQPPRRPLLLVSGHTHRADLQRARNLTLLNPGSVGGGGTGNLAEGAGEIGLARLVYSSDPRFKPLAADLVEIDPGDGSASAERFRLDAPLTEDS
ncbi:MAG: metallophosphoesterase [Actinomycetota bacterium]|nr:metallophosphoesterase [Actinomycetota bacterium]